MADSIVRLKVEGEIYDMPALTLGELRLAKRHYGVTDFTVQDADTVAALVYVAMRRANPDWEDARLLNTVDDVTSVEILVDEDGEDPKGASAEPGE